MTKVQEATPDLLNEIAPPKPTRAKAVARVEQLPPPAPMNMLAIIANAASNPAVDVSKMRELLTMQREIIAEEARIAFTEDFVAMAPEMPSINRDGKIVIEGKAGRRGQSTPYSTFENMYQIISPILSRHGFRYWSEPDLGNEQSPIVMRGHLDHIKGHGKTCAIPLPFETSGSKNNVQGVGSSLSYGRRYCLINLCSIISHAPSDRDDDGAAAGTGEAITEEQLQELIDLKDSVGAPLDKLVTYLNGKRPRGHVELTGLAQLPASRFEEALETIKSYRPKK